MLNPRILTNAIRDVLVTNADLLALVPTMNVFHYNLGSERTLLEALSLMTSPSIMIYWDGTQGGNFSGSEIWKHRFNIVMRSDNQKNNSYPHSYEDIWWALCNGHVNGTQRNIRQLSIVPDVDLVDTPSVSHMTDGEGNDYFVGSFVLPEIGDV